MDGKSDSMQLITIIVGVISLLGPISVMLLGNWLKGSVGKIEQITPLLIEMQHMKTKLDELKAQVQVMNLKLTDLNNNYILTKNEVKTQWSRFDEFRTELKEKSFK